jgi:peptidoglycan/LPS O-acetylase OafA/YrhL
MTPGTPAKPATPSRPAASRPGELTRLAKVAAAIQMTLGSYLGLGAALLTAAAASSQAAAQDSDADALAQVRLWAIGLGLVIALGGRLAWRGNTIGRVSGIAFGVLFGFLAAVAIVDPLPGVPGVVSVPAAVILLGLMIYIVVVDVFAWRQHR